MTLRAGRDDNSSMSVPYWMSPLWAVVRLCYAFGFPLLLSLVSIWVSHQLDLPGTGMRYTLVPLVIGFWIFWRSATFLKVSLNLPNVLDSLTRIVNVFFTPSYPEVQVLMGEVLEQGYVGKLLKLIGGPATLSISPENAVLLESVEGKLRLLSHGKHRAFAHERLKQVIDLKEREGWVLSRTATSLDGIPIEIKDVRYRFRPCRRGRLSETEKMSPTVFAYDEEALIYMVYNQAFDEEGVANWEKAVEGTILSVITRYVNQHQAMELIAPHLYHLDARAEIYHQLFSPNMQQRLFKLGVELTWIDIGHFSWPEVLHQSAGSWSSQWVKDLAVLQGYDRSQRAQYQEIGRREAQAEMIISLVHALQQKFEEASDRGELREQMVKQVRQVIEKFRGDLIKQRSSV